jgi:homoserine O-acetyltransferase
VLFGPGQLLDATKYFIILPDGIGHGKSSKPSDGLHMKFPKYTYDDMVEALHEVLTKKLGVNHLRLVMGTSMGGMQTWVWGEMYPDFMDALMPLASNPVELAGRNRIWRFMAIDAIKNDADWMGGEYKTQPIRGLTTAEDLLLLAGSAPLNWQAAAPTRARRKSSISIASSPRWHGSTLTISSISSKLRVNTIPRRNSKRSKRR